MRSLLFVPGDSEKKLEKGFRSGADVVIVDLEDSVAAGQQGGGARDRRGFHPRRAARGGAEDLRARQRSCRPASPTTTSRR